MPPHPLEHFYYSIPPITRTYLTLSLILSSLVSFSILSPFQLYLNYNLVWNKGEWWRLATAFLYFDKFGLNLVFHVYFLYFYCRRLEEHSFHNKHSDFLIMLLFACGAMLLLSPLLNLPFMSHSLIVMILYVWSRRNPTEQLRLYGLFLIPASYLPYILLGLSILMGNGIWVDVLGMSVGHAYYYLNDVIPITFGVQQPLRAPRILRKLFREERDEVQVTEEVVHEQQNNNAQGGLFVDDDDDDAAWNIQHND